METDNNIKEIKKSCYLRSCFDSSSSEWHDSTMDEKIGVLKKLVKEDGDNTLRLAIGMKSYCNDEAGKDIKDMDLIVSMGKLLDHLLKEKV